ncbi:MAG: T9SS type A sorting domain-containing protein [Chitinophagales bacterium]|nr:T9SS type A sorting domain-containing protein [Chitinophagales bacterium]
MKKKKLLIAFIGILSAICTYAQPLVWSQNIQATSIDLRTAVVKLGQIPINAPSAGTVVVRFDGFAVIDVGDRVLFAASDNGDWGVNEGHVSIEVPSSDVNRKSFSHTMTYNISAGADTFYAVAFNSSVEADGNGIGSVYGHLTVEFFPSAGTAFAQCLPITFSGNVEGAPVVVKQAITNFPSAGKAVVRFDGFCISDVGDRIVLAASDIADWGVNDGNVTCEAYTTDENRNPFSHTRVYNVTAGADTFFAVAQNFVETDGNGSVSIYGHLTVEFFPDAGNAEVEYQVVSQSANLRGAPVTLATINFNAPSAGKAVVTFDGYCVSSAGDRIILAASNIADWGVNDGASSVEAFDSDINSNSFSHSRTYTVAAGSNTFYAVGENYVETDGSGSASIYGNFTLKFFPDAASGITESDNPANTFTVYPNPASETAFVVFENTGTYSVKLHDLAGREIIVPQQANEKTVALDLSLIPDGVYLLRVGESVRKIVKQ